MSSAPAPPPQRPGKMVALAPAAAPVPVPAAAPAVMTPVRCRSAPTVASSKKAARGSVTIVPGGPEGRSLRGGGGGRNSVTTVEPLRFDMCEPTRRYSLTGSSTPEQCTASPKEGKFDITPETAMQGISVEYEALDQFSADLSGSEIWEDERESAEQEQMPELLTDFELPEECW